MIKRAGAGSLNHIVWLQQRATTDDGFGNVESNWVNRFQEPCRLAAKLGGETVFASRVQGTQPYIMTVRGSTRTRAIDGSWRAVNARTGAVYNIKTAVNVDERNALVELLVVQGEAS